MERKGKLQAEEITFFRQKTKDLNTELKQREKEVNHLKNLLDQSNKEAKEAARKQESRTRAEVNATNELTAARTALEEALSRNKVLESTIQEQCDRIKELHKLEKKNKKVRSNLSNEIEDLKNKLSKMEEHYKMDLSEREKVFQMRLNNLSGDWKTKAKEWARRQEILEENEKRSRELLNENEKIKREMADREEHLKTDQAEQEKAFQRRLQDLSEY